MLYGHQAPCRSYQGEADTAQDYPGRTKLWHVGVPPSGPMDALAFRLANALVGNKESAAGLEITLSGVRSLTTSQVPITLCRMSAESLQTI
jgi:urea carboxylase